MRNSSVRTAAAATLVLALVGSGCSSNPNQSAANSGAADDKQPFSITLGTNSAGPAPEVAGAKPGGVITNFSPVEFQTDPALMGTDFDEALGDLIYRTLTVDRATAAGGLEVVGDLATNAGETADGGRTWKYTLREGLKYEDGRPISARDIGYGLARSFSPELAMGPRTLQKWLAGSDDYNKEYKGPYAGGSQTPPGVEVPDDRTIIFKFDRPRPHFPYLAATPAVAPVPKDKDTKKKYGNRPVASGPYKIARYDRGRRLVLERNTFWDANTDPLRHQYVDGISFDFGLDTLQISERLIADRGPDQTAMTFWFTAPEVMPRVLGNPEILKRTVEGPTSSVQSLFINTKRVTDLKVRQAINYAIDRDAFVKTQGGPKNSEPATTILSPLTPGFQQYNAYDGGPTGDPEKARQLLGGRTVELTYPAGTSTFGQRRALTIKTALERAGFRLKIQPVDSQSYWSVVSAPDNPFDVMLGGSVGVWPDASYTLRPELHGSEAKAGGANISQLNDPALNAKMDQLGMETDQAKVVAGWAALDREIMEKYAPMVPLTYIRNFTLNGSRVGGVELDIRTGLPSLIGVYVK